MFESCLELVDEYSELERQLAVPEVHNDQELARSLGRRYAQLRAVVAGYREWASLADDVAAATELAADDESFAAELPGLVAREAIAAERLTQLLLPRDPLDDKDVIVRPVRQRPPAPVRALCGAPRLVDPDPRCR